MMEGEKSQGQGDEGQQKQEEEDKLPRLYLDTIPVEVLLQIFKFVDATDLLRNVSLVSKYFHGILSNEMTWKIKMDKRWGNMGGEAYPPMQLLPDDDSSLKSQYSANFTISRFPWSRACVKREEQIKLWTTESNLDSLTLTSHVGCIDSCLLFKQSGRMMLASGSRDRAICIWNVDEHLGISETTSKCRTRRAHDGWIWDFAVSNEQLYSCSWDTTAKIWDLNTLTEVSSFKYSSALLSISVSQSQTAIGSFNRKILLVDPRLSAKPRTLSTHTKSVLRVRLDDNYLISCGEDGIVARHDLRTNSLESSVSLPRDDSSRQPYPTCMSFRNTTLNLPYFYVGDNLGNIHLTSLLDLKILSTVKLHNSPVRGVFNNLGSVVSCSRNGKLVVSTPSVGLTPLRTIDIGEKTELPCVHALDNALACGDGNGVVHVFGSKSVL